MNTSFTFLWITFPCVVPKEVPNGCTKSLPWITCPCVLQHLSVPTLNPPQNSFPNCLLRPHRALCDRQDSPIRPRYFDGAQSADTYFVGLTRALMHHCLKKTVLGLAGHFNRLRLRDLLSISAGNMWKRLQSYNIASSCFITCIRFTNCQNYIKVMPSCMVWPPQSARSRRSARRKECSPPDSDSQNQSSCRKCDCKILPDKYYKIHRKGLEQS